MPISICEEIERECANFWWDMDNGKKQMHWKRWKYLCLSKQKGGIYWRIGNGETTRVVKDKWILGCQGTIKPIAYGLEDQRVSSLLVDGKWNEPFIVQHFDQNVVDQILKIPLLSSDEIDIRFWKNDSKGKYSVRNGYHSACDLYLPPMHQSSYKLEAWWKFIWNLNIPPKVKILWWRLSHDIIPTSANLKDHHIPIPPSCIFCGFYCDSSVHALFLCPVMRKVWKQTDLWNTILGLRDVDTLDCCNWLKTQLDIPQFERLATFTWGLWKSRITVAHEKEYESTNQNLDWCEKLLEEFQKAGIKIDKVNNPTFSLGSEGENAPNKGILQMEVDACVNVKKQHFGIGGVLKDFDGRILQAFGMSIAAPSSVVEGELIVIHEGIKFIHARGIRRCRIVSDSLISVQAVMKSEEDFTYIGARVNQIKMLTNDTETGELRHISRSLNTNAHALARFASFIPISFVWDDGILPFWLEDCTL
ncbi:uncharacterized protein [Henckelia pumila]|uniref:uncharacterized protein n=1 Tax=Henckelia pumila TaxID=405737 RepID=UPI003C6E0898